MKPNKQATELFLLAKEDCESCAGLVQLGIGHRVVCFLAQQTVEKCFKALLAQRNITYPFTHDLMDLWTLLQKHRIECPMALDMLKMLNPFAVEIRYGMPDIEFPDAETVLAVAQQGLGWCEECLYA